jgi:hypothetical protein
LKKCSYSWKKQRALKALQGSPFQPGLESLRPLHTHDHQVIRLRIKVDLDAALGVLVHLGDGLKIQHELPVDPEKLLRVQQLSQFR